MRHDAARLVALAGSISTCPYSRGYNERVSSNLPVITPEGDRAARVEFGNVIDPVVNRRVHRFCRAIDEACIDGVDECVPAFATAVVYFDSRTTAFDEVAARLTEIATVDGGDVDIEIGQLIEIPVMYGDEFGPDLERLSLLHGIGASDVIELHSGTEYLCYMVGFMPGFPYLGELPPSIRTARLSTPRTRVPAGSVAIADGQTGIYPRETPGGWNVIGRTSLQLFDPAADPPSLIKPGDRVRFVPI